MNSFAILFKLVEEPYFRLVNREYFFVKVVECRAFGFKAELKAVGIQRLELVAELFVLAVHAVFAVAEKRMTD